MRYVAVAAIAIVVIVAFQLLVAEPLRVSNRQEMWSRGYCAALGGEWVTAEVCNVNGKVVPIPTSE